MARLPAWMPSLIRQINEGLSESPLLSVSIKAEDALVAGRQICVELWPFIEQLPRNIQSVRDRVPVDLEATRKLLDQMADEDGYYQGLYLKQCLLGGVSREELDQAEPCRSIENLCRATSRYANDSDYKNGVLAIIAAELSCTAFARAALPVFERYFAVRDEHYTKEQVEEGLAWLNVHTSLQTRHARWMKTSLSEIGAGEQMPVPVIEVVEAVFGFWQLDESVSRSKLARQSEPGSPDRPDPLVHELVRQN